MLKNSFIFLKNVGQKKEKYLWDQGITNWQKFLKKDSIKHFSKKTKFFHNQKIKQVQQALREENLSQLVKSIPKTQLWRLYPHFKDEALFLDIETKGPYGNIILIGLSDGYETKVMLKGYNLNKSLLLKTLTQYKLLVTFNGSSFDIPIIERYFNTKIPIPHLDLLGPCSQVGLRGGLKSIEKQLNIKRPSSLNKVTGHDAANLWRFWKATGDEDILKLLLTYNEEDCANLKDIADIIIPRLWEKTFKKSPNL